MGTNVHLTAEPERFAQRCAARGRLNNVREVVRAGLRVLQDDEARREAFVASLQEAVAAGDRGGFFTSDDKRAELECVIEAARLRKA